MHQSLCQRQTFTTLFLLLALLLCNTTIFAKTNSEYFTLQQGPLTQTLIAISGAFGVDIVGPQELLEDKVSNPIIEAQTIEQALAQALKGSGLVAKPSDSGGFVIERVESSIDTKVTSDIREVDVETILVVGDRFGAATRLGPLGYVNKFDSPFSVESYAENVLRDYDIKEYGELARFDASIVNSDPQSAGGNIASSIYQIRGFPVQGQFALYNGLPLVGRIDSFAQIERFEVFKGPSIVIANQTGAVGGTLNFVPKRAESDSVQEVFVRFQNSENITVNLDVGKRFGANEAFGLRLNASRQEGDISIDNISPDRSTIALAADYRSDTIRATLDLDYAGTDGIFNPRLAASGTTTLPEPPNGDTFFGQTWFENDRSLARGIAKVEYDLASSFTIAVSAAKTREDTELLAAFSGGLADNSGEFTATPFTFYSFEDRTVGAIDIFTEFQTGTVEHEFSIALQTFEIDRGINFLVAGDDYQDSFINPISVPRPDVTVPDSRPNVGSDQRINSVAIVDNLSFLDGRLRIPLGARFTDFRSRNIDAATGAIIQVYEDDDINYVLGAIFKLTPSFSIYGNYMEGFEPGLLIDESSPNAGELIPPGIAEQIEFGVKFQADSWDSTLALFTIERPSILFDPISRIASGNGLQRNKGIEANVIGEIAEGYRLIASASYIDAEQVSTAGGINDGNTAQGVPDFSINLNFEADINGIPNLTLSASLNYVGSTSVDAANTLEAPSYTTFDIGAKYVINAESNHPTIVRASIQNLTDEDYFIISGFGELTVGPPRVFAVSASMSF